jgi:hypothetical protein
VTQFLFKQLSLTLVFWLLAPVASLTQESGPRAGAGAKADSAQFSTARVIDVEAARRAKEREHSTKPLDFPLLPFRYLGCQIEKGLIAVDRHHLAVPLGGLLQWAHRTSSFGSLFVLTMHTRRAESGFADKSLKVYLEMKDSGFEVKGWEREVVTHFAYEGGIDRKARLPLR